MTSRCLDRKEVRHVRFTVFVIFLSTHTPCVPKGLDMMFCDVILTVNINNITRLCDVIFIDSGVNFF